MSSPLSGFTAVPNPQMLAFMGAQSFIMMFQAGEGWQYGKRRISAMSNEDFNKLTPLRLLQNQAANLRSSLSTIQKSMNDMTPMIATIIEQYGDFLKEVIRVTPPTLLAVSGGTSPQDIIQNYERTTGKVTTGPERQALADFIRNLGNLIPSVPLAGATSGGAGLVREGPPPPSSKLNIYSSGGRKEGFLGGPPPVISVAERFRAFQKTRNLDSQKLVEMQRTLKRLIQQLGISQRIQWSRTRQSIKTLALARAKKLKLQIASLERDIVFTKIKIARK